jgi:hypothetical protein
MHGTDVDDATPAALLDHLLGRELRAEEGTLEIDCQHLVVLILRGVDDRCARFDAGVLYHDVQPAEPAYRRSDELLQVGELAHIRIDADRRAPSDSSSRRKR